MCTEQLPPGGYPIAVKYISYHIIMETELNREKKWFKREGQPHIAIAQISSPI